MNLSKISNPAVDFLQQTNVIELETLFRLYAKYLLHSSGALELPVPLHRVREHHGFQKHTASIEQRGFLLGDKDIFVNNDDLRTVQQFTEAHEMMETLFIALDAEIPSRFSSNMRQSFLENKERLCDLGAAELVMPTELLFPLVAKKGLSLATGGELSKLCQTSLTATIRQMLSADVAPCVFGYLKEGYKKSEQVLLKESQEKPPQPELRVWKYWRSPQTKVFLCQNESFARNTSIYQTLSSNTPGRITYSYDKLNLKKIKGVYRTESMLVTISDMPVVMVLIHL